VHRWQSGKRKRLCLRPLLHHLHDITASTAPTKENKRKEKTPPKRGLKRLSRLRQVRSQFQDGVPEYRRDGQQCTEYPRTLACTEFESERPAAQP